MAALEQIRTRLLRVISALEEGDNDRAMSELDAASDDWARAIAELRS